MKNNCFCSSPTLELNALFTLLNKLWLWRSDGHSTADSGAKSLVFHYESLPPAEKVYSYCAQFSPVWAAFYILFAKNEGP